MPESPFLSDDRIPEVYADGVIDVGFGNGVVRIDLFSLSPRHKGADNQPLPVVRQRVIMSLQGFLGSLAALEGMRDRLEQAGILRAVAAPAASDPVAAPSPPRSPNFD